MLDGSGEVVRPALIWCDVRTDKQCKELNEKIGADRLIQLTCNPALAKFHAHKILVDARERTGELEARSFRDAPERLCSFQPDR